VVWFNKENKEKEEEVIIYNKGQLVLWVFHTHLLWVFHSHKDLNTVGFSLALKRKNKNKWVFHSHLSFVGFSLAQLFRHKIFCSIPQIFYHCSQVLLPLNVWVFVFCPPPLGFYRYSRCQFPKSLRRVSRCYLRLSQPCSLSYFLVFV